MRSAKSASADNTCVSGRAPFQEGPQSTGLTWHAPVLVLKTRLVPSALAETSLLPVVLKDTSRISSLWPRSVWTHCPDATSHTLQVRSMLPLMHRSDPKLNCETQGRQAFLKKENTKTDERKAGERKK